MTEAIHPKPIPENCKSVHLMLTCLCDAFYPNVGMATVKVLESLGFDVEFDEKQTCCGQPAFNSGDRKNAIQVARHTIEVFKNAPIIICPSGSCAAMIRWGYPQLFRDQPDLDQAKDIALRTWELSEFLNHVTQGKWKGSYKKRISFHRSCHLRELLPYAGPEKLLQSIQGLKFQSIKTPEQCCGFGGAFSVTFPQTSNEMGCMKLSTLAEDNPDEFVSSDMGCLMHLKGLQDKEVKEKGIANNITFKHYVEILSESLEN